MTFYDSVENLKKNKCVMLANGKLLGLTLTSITTLMTIDNGPFFAHKISQNS